MDVGHGADVAVGFGDFGDGVALAVLMLTGGIAGAVGNFAAGSFTDKMVDPGWWRSR